MFGSCLKNACPRRSSYPSESDVLFQPVNMLLYYILILSWPDGDQINWLRPQMFWPKAGPDDLLSKNVLWVCFAALLATDQDTQCDCFTY